MKWFRVGGPVSGKPADIASIRPFHAPCSCLDVYGGTDTNNAGVSLSGCKPTNGANQAWVIEPNGKDLSVMPMSRNDPVRYYKKFVANILVRSRMLGYCLEVSQGTFAAGRQLIVNTCTGANIQRWSNATGANFMTSAGATSGNWCASTSGPDNGERQTDSMLDAMPKRMIHWQSAPDAVRHIRMHIPDSARPSTSCCTFAASA